MKSKAKPHKSGMVPPKVMPKPIPGMVKEMKAKPKPKKKGY